MAEEKKEIESSEEDNANDAAEAEEAKKKSEEEDNKEKEKNEFEKDKEFVPASKYNQSIRKQREIELENRELKKQLEDKSSTSGKKEEEEDNFGDDEEEEGDYKKPDTSKLIDEKMKPVLDKLEAREEKDRKLSRAAFFDTHPEYEKSGEKWQELLDVLDNDINPKSQDDYYTQLEKAHRILSGENYDAEVEDKKKDMAGDAAAGGDGAEKGGIKDEFTAEDRNIQKKFGISDEGMKAYKKKIESGEMVIMS